MTAGAAPHWFDALDGDDRAECLRELHKLIAEPAAHPGPLETALAEWKRTGEALSDPTARDILTGPLDLDEFVEVGPPQEPLPEGEYARVEVMGHASHTGWVTESTRAGQPVMVIRDWDGQVVAEVPGHSLYRFLPLATPQKRPDPEPVRAITSGLGPWGGDPDWSSAEDSIYDEGAPF